MGKQPISISQKHLRSQKRFFGVVERLLDSSCAMALVPFSGDDPLEDRGFMPFAKAFAETSRFKEVPRILLKDNIFFDPLKKVGLENLENYGSWPAWRSTNILTCMAEVGMTVLVDQSGRLFSKQKCSLKDIVANQEVWGGWRFGFLKKNN